MHRDPKLEDSWRVQRYCIKDETGISAEVEVCAQVNDRGDSVGWGKAPGSITLINGESGPQGASQLAANKGLGGNQPTSLAIGPDGAAYFGNLKNNNLLRLPQPTNTDPNQNVISVGGIQSGKPIYALTFNGSQLYAGVGDGFYVFGANSDITQCSGNQNNCGIPKLLMGGTSVNGVAADGLGHVYLVAGNSGILYRYNVSAATFTQVDAGLLIEVGHTSTLGFDKDGNLWVGEQPVADLPNGGRERVYLATDLAGLQ